MIVDVIRDRLAAGAEAVLTEHDHPELRERQREVIAELRRAELAFMLGEVAGLLTLRAWHLPPWGTPRESPARHEYPDPDPRPVGRFRRDDRRDGGIRRRAW